MKSKTEQTHRLANRHLAQVREVLDRTLGPRSAGIDAKILKKLTTQPAVRNDIPRPTPYAERGGGHGSGE